MSLLRLSWETVPSLALPWGGECPVPQRHRREPVFLWPLSPYPCRPLGRRIKYQDYTALRALYCSPFPYYYFFRPGGSPTRSEGKVPELLWPKLKLPPVREDDLRFWVFFKASYIALSPWILRLPWITTGPMKHRSLGSWEFSFL